MNEYEEAMELAHQCNVMSSYEGEPDRIVALVRLAKQRERTACAIRAEKYMLAQYGNHYGVSDAVRSNDTKEGA